MSKTKPKDKKNQNQTGLQKQIDQKRRQILDASFTIRKLQERLDQYIMENKSLEQKYQQLRVLNQEEIEKLKIIIDSKQAQINQLLTKSSLSEIQNKQKEARIKKLQNHLNDEIERKNKEYQALKINSFNDIKILENKLKEFEIYMNQKEQMEKDRIKLKQMLQFERAQKIRQLADKDREKVQATDKLKNDMLHKIQQTKTSLLSLKKQQLSTTTRLTVLQNHQLTSELEYQSKQTEKLLFRNQQLESKVVQLQRDLQIHKQVEQQLAKRSHFSRGIIKKLTQRIKQLQEGQENNKKDLNDNFNKSEIKQNGDKKKTEVIYAMQKNIEGLQKNLSKLQNDYDILKDQNYYLQTRLDEFDNKIQKLGTLLVRYMDDILEGHTEVKQQNYIYDLRNLKSKDVKQWHKEDVNLTVTVLLNVIKPFITKKNITFSIPRIPQNLSIQDTDQNDTPINTTLLPQILSDPSNLQKSRKTDIKSRLHQMPLNIATKIVASNLREWGKPLENSSSSVSLCRKYKIGQITK